MTVRARPTLDQPNATVSTLQGASAVVGDAATQADLAYQGMGYRAEETNEPRLQTFDEMLPAARAFYRKS